MDKSKTFFTVIGTAISAWFGYIAIAFVILVGLNFTDYITAIGVAPKRGQKIESRKGIKGIIKKIYMWVLVAIGGVLDWLILYAVAKVGIVSPFKFIISSAVVIWLICNEIISILENIGDSGVDLPPFLMKAVQWIKQGTEQQMKIKAVAGLQTLRDMAEEDEDEKDLPIT